MSFAIEINALTFFFKLTGKTLDWLVLVNYIYLMFFFFSETVE